MFHLYNQDIYIYVYIYIPICINPVWSHSAIPWRHWKAFCSRRSSAARAEVTIRRHVLSRDDEASAKHDGKHVTRGEWGPSGSPKCVVGMVVFFFSCGDVFFFVFPAAKRNRRIRGWWRPKDPTYLSERWMNVPSDFHSGHHEMGTARRNEG